MTLDPVAFCDELNRVFALNGLEPLLSDGKADLLTAFAAYLVEENEKFNLTALTSPDAIVLRHFADCASLVSRLPDVGKLIDVGCGAGFPSVVLAILCPSLAVTALDATEKKVRFVSGCAERLGLQNLHATVGRAETLAAPGASLRESFDVATARAVARLPILSELCLPFVSCGGAFFALKGREAEREAEEAKTAIPQLGGELVGVFSRTLSDGVSDPVRHAVVEIAKKRKTPPEFPRLYARILKKPL